MLPLLLSFGTSNQYGFSYSVYMNQTLLHLNRWMDGWTEEILSCNGTYNYNAFNCMHRIQLEFVRSSVRILVGIHIVLNHCRLPMAQRLDTTDREQRTIIIIMCGKPTLQRQPRNTRIIGALKQTFIVSVPSFDHSNNLV